MGKYCLCCKKELNNAEKSNEGYKVSYGHTTTKYFKGFKEINMEKANRYEKRDVDTVFNTTKIDNIEPVIFSICKKCLKKAMYKNIIYYSSIPLLLLGISVFLVIIIKSYLLSIFPILGIFPIVEEGIKKITIGDKAIEYYTYFIAHKHNIKSPQYMYRLIKYETVPIDFDIIDKTGKTPNLTIDMYNEYLSKLNN